MADMLENISRLAGEIGPRPAGSEEEHEAALYIEEQLRETGLPVEMEEFSGMTTNAKALMLCAAISAVATVLAMISSLLMIPAIILTALSAVMMVLDELGKPVLAKILDHGMSQNVVAKYVPEGQKAGARSRKIIVVARYDSGYKQNELHGPLVGIVPILKKASRIAFVVLPVLLLVKSLFFLNVAGVVAIIWNVILVICVVLVLLPLIAELLHRASGYNAAAVNNASGVAVMIEAARRVAAGNTARDYYEDYAYVHGEEEAYKADVVPEGASLVYEADVTAPRENSEFVEQGAFDTAYTAATPAHDNTAFANVDPDSEEGRLLAAKQAIAAMTGKPVPQTISLSFGSSRETKATAPQTQGGDSGLAASSAAVGLAAGAAVVAAGTATAAGTQTALVGGASAATDAFASAATSTNDAVIVREPEQETTPEPSAPASTHTNSGGFTDVPDWFKAGRDAAAQKTQGVAPAEGTVKRSVFADALDHASERASVPATPRYEGVTFQDSNSVAARLQAIRETAETATAPSYNEELVSDIDAQALQSIQVETTQTAEPRRLKGVDALFGSASEAPAVSDLPNPFALPEETPIQNTVSQETTAIPSTLQGVFSEVPAVEEPAVIEVPALEASETPLPKIKLPSLGFTSEMEAIGESKQRAPLAEAAENGQAAAKSMLNMLPVIDLSDATNSQADANTRMNLPSLSGALPVVEPVSEADDPMNYATQAFVSIPSSTGAFQALNASNSGAFQAVTPGSTGSFAPVTEALIMNADDEEDLIIEDADDTGIEAEFTETGAFAGPGYVEMPKSRAGGFFSRLFGRKEKDETPVNAWLNVDDDFDARSVGAQRGSWESFREEDAEETAGETYDTYENYDEYEEFDGFEGDAYEGDADLEFADEYAYRHATQAKAHQAAPVFPAQQQYDEYESYDEYDSYDGSFEDDYFDGTESFGFDDEDEWKGGAFSKLQSLAGRRKEAPAFAENEDEQALDTISQMPAYETRETARSSRSRTEDRFEMQDNSFPAYTTIRKSATERHDESLLRMTEEASDSITAFRAADIATEVWFVALGSDVNGQCGMKQFLADYASELRGATVIELESLGAGDLCYVEKEGIIRTVGVAARMKRALNKAAQACGMRLDGVDLSWRESAASVAKKAGIPSLHLVGMEGNTPALIASADDVIDNVEEDTLAQNTDYVVELLRNL